MGPSPEIPSKPTEPLTPTADTVMTGTLVDESLKKKDTSVKEGASAASAGEVHIYHTTQANGEVPPPPDKEPAPETENTQDREDAQMDNDSTPAASTVQPAAANGTPSTNKRASVGGSSKKKSGVPEHKNKKPNKKKRPDTHLDAKPGDYYFAVMKGHPPWPSIICDESMLPHSLISTRPVTAALPDGSFKREDYADGGKRAYERTFPIMFLHTNEFAWMPNQSLTPLDPESEAVKNPSDKGKSKTLLAAYSKAAENNELDAFRTMLMEHQKAIQEDMALQEERAAKKAEKSKKAAARKSSDAKAADDAMSIDDETNAEKPKSKKRKKASDDSGEDEKPAKTPKTATKLKLSTPKQPTESATKKKSQKPKAKTAKSGSDEDDPTPKVEEKQLSAQELKNIKEKKVLYYRHKLQRGFLSRDALPRAEEMQSMSDFLAELETYPDLEGSIIRTTKIHKVLKQMMKIDQIPLEEEFKFRDRSSMLLGRWNDTLNTETAVDGKADDKVDAKAEDNPAEPRTEEAPQADEEDVAPTTNGVTRDHDMGSEPKEGPSQAAAEADPAEKLEKKIGTTVEGEKEADEEPAGDDAMELEKTAEEKETDGPAVDSAPAEGYKPPAEEVVAAAA